MSTDNDNIPQGEKKVLLLIAEKGGAISVEPEVERLLRLRLRLRLRLTLVLMIKDKHGIPPHQYNFSPKLCDPNLLKDRTPILNLMW